MTCGWRRGSGWALVLTLAVAVGTGWAKEASTFHSGRIEAIDKTTGSLVVGEVGPWRVKEGKTEITRRTIVVTSSTEWVRLGRSEGAGPSGWAGEAIETSITPWDVKAGDVVTVRVRRDSGRLIAIRVSVATPDRP